MTFSQVDFAPHYQHYGQTQEQDKFSHSDPQMLSPFAS
ncbi:hypothetical protein AM1_0869 [Acaryochloris marina MBIC11017]|uniref:Uncharacterized protein n=1 Tax=Acaryochloris marina (strain MBIC 11017) TaxID=329726 RepID=B0BYM8_ACAM1|nr:hypothetical protein AM1_0869 [Acaryochloris marina MBIC11017]